MWWRYRRDSEPALLHCRTTLAYWNLSPLERNFRCLIAYHRNNVHSSGIWGPETQTQRRSKRHSNKGRVEPQVDQSDRPWHKLARLAKLRWWCGMHRCCEVAVGGSTANTDEEGNWKTEVLGEDWELLIDGREAGTQMLTPVITGASGAHIQADLMSEKAVAGPL